MLKNQLRVYYGLDFFPLASWASWSQRHSRPSDSNVSEDAGTEPRTVATSALAVKRSNHSARSHPQYNLLRLVGSEAYLQEILREAASSFLVYFLRLVIWLCMLTLGILKQKRQHLLFFSPLSADLLTKNSESASKFSQPVSFVDKSEGFVARYSRQTLSCWHLTHLLRIILYLFMLDRRHAFCHKQQVLLP